MAINKNFVIKNGAEINTKLFVADADNQKIGIGTTTASYTLHVFGDDGNGGIGATYVYASGITTTQALNVLGVSTFSTGPVLIAAGEQTGTASQGLQVGTAVTVSGAYISGNLGIGRTLPDAKLDIVPTASGVAGLFSGTTSNDMVRITQLGAGNALVVEDGANPDATSFVVSGLGSVGIGTNVPRFLLDIDATSSTGTTAVYIRGDVKITGDLSADDLIFDQASLNTLNVSGFSTFGGVSATLLNVSGVGTVAGGFEVSEGLNAARANVTGITTLGQVNVTGLSNAGVSTLGNATANTLVVSGFSTLGGASATLLSVSGVTTVSGGLEASQGLNAARVNVTGITTLGSATATELKVTGITTLGDATATNAVVSGFSTLGAVSATNVSLAGIVTGLNVPGISTLVSLTGTDVNYTGVGTIANLRATNVNVSGVTTTDSLIVNTTFDVYDADSTFHGNVTIDGNLSIGGTSTIINAQSLVVQDKDIVLGFTTSQPPNNDTANHGGIAIASTEGSPLVSLQVAGINTLPDTYKQIMWVKENTMGAGTTAAWLFNYSVGIGSTQVPNDVRLAVGAVQVTDTTVNSENLVATNINASGITSTNSLNIGATQVISSGRQLQNIASLDATTTATIEAAIANAPNQQTDLKVTGISTLGQVTAEGLVVTGITTLGQTSTVGLINAGVSTLGNATASTLVVSGVTTVGVVTGATSVQAGVFYGDGSKLQNIISGVGIQSAGNVVGYGVTTLNFIGIGNTFAYNPATNTVDVSIRGGGGSSGFATYIAGIATASSVGVNTTNLDDPDLTGIGNSFKGLYIGNGMMIVDNQLNGDHYIGTNFNGLMAGPVTVNGTLTVDGNWVVV